ncbi:MAG: sigma 54-interacting transcriptional regulator [Holophagales bacterium]|nr:sigma 54-interacting transcriptional regulator [Holophagales bacterium]
MSLPSPRPSRLRLRADIEGQTRLYPLADGGQIVGSGRDADLRVRSAGISRRHARLEVGGADGVRVLDLDSKNGTAVDGRALGPGEERMLEPGRVLELGPVVLRLERAPADDVELALELSSLSPSPAGGPTEVGPTAVVTSPARRVAGAASRATWPELVWPPGHVPGRSPAMVAVYRQVRTLLQGDVPVLLAGETGSGKEHVARLLHASSPRGRGPFVALNCAAIPAELLEAELFGIASGVATGVKARQGKLPAAQGGTLLLDEIGDMPQALQAKLLRVLQERWVEPVGGAAVELDVRVISATHADLRWKVEEGTFRGDLFYRLAGFELTVPPLRHRRDDIPALVTGFAERAAAETGKRIPGFTGRTLRLLSAHPWPGNVRELEHEVRRLIYLCPEDQAVHAELLSETIRASAAEPGPIPAAPARAAPPEEKGGLVARLEALERRLIVAELEAQGGNQTRTAEALGISRNGLLQRMKRLRIPTSTGRGGGEAAGSSREAGEAGGEGSAGGSP